MNKILIGDCLKILPTLEAESIQCCVTSPPYWGLRDYGVDDQLGLEKTPEEYVDKMVQVFQQVKRVLRLDGTLWLNLGSSYAGSKKGIGADGTVYAGEKQKTNIGSIGLPVIKTGFGDTSPNQFRSDEASCDNDGKERPGFQGTGLVCSRCGGERQDDYRNHRNDNSRNTQELPLNASPPCKKGHDTVHQDLKATSLDVSVPSVQKSTTLASFRRDRASCVPSTKASVSPLGNHSSFDDVRMSSGKKACICGTFQHDKTLVSHIQDMEFSSKASKPSNGLINDNIATMFQNIKFKPKDMVPIPWMVAMALQADGWYLRSDIIWHKPNPMPESVTDRPTKSHEYLFLMAKSQKYYYNAGAIKEKVVTDKDSSSSMAFGSINGKLDSTDKAHAANVGHKWEYSELRNKRTVWTIPTAPYIQAHFSTFPPDLVKPCILAGSKPNDLVMDPFSGSGTVGQVCAELCRDYTGIELNQEYANMRQEARAVLTMPL